MNETLTFSDSGLSRPDLLRALQQLGLSAQLLNSVPTPVLECLFASLQNGSNSATPGSGQITPADQGPTAGAAFSERRKQLLSSSQLGQAALKAANNSVSDTDPQNAGSSPSWLAGGRNPNNSRAHVKFSEARALTTRFLKTDDQRKRFVSLLETSPTPANCTPHAARLAHLKSLTVQGRTPKPTR